jgi:hypothetical protein
MFYQKDTINEMQGNILGTFDNKFDSRYSVLLIYSPNEKKYIDIDSYKMELDDNKVAMFDVDQEINIIDKDKKTINRIEFYGTYCWIEDAFWVNDSVFVLLGNTDVNSLFINIYDLINKRKIVYEYKSNLNFYSEYYTQRLIKKGIIIEN